MSDFKMEKLQDLVDSSSSRRDFAKRIATVSALGVAGAAVAKMTGITGEAAALLNDVDILNFALNLEYLEAEFYTVGVSGKRIADLGIGITGRGKSGATVGGGQVAFTDSVRPTVTAIADDEQKHVVFLRAALRSAAVAKPSINLAALGIGYSNQAEFLTLARAFEDTGVTAYGGAAPLIQGKEVLGYAARIALTEALHAGAIRDLVRLNNIPTAALDSLDVPVTSAKPFMVDANGLAIVRTPSQVLSIVYAKGRTSGGFFPDGVNGTIVSV